MYIQCACDKRQYRNIRFLERVMYGHVIGEWKWAKNWKGTYRDWIKHRKQARIQVCLTLSTYDIAASGPFPGGFGGFGHKSCDARARFLTTPPNRAQSAGARYGQYVRGIKISPKGPLFWKKNPTIKVLETAMSPIPNIFPFTSKKFVSTFFTCFSNKFTYYMQSCLGTGSCIQRSYVSWNFAMRARRRCSANLRSLTEPGSLLGHGSTELEAIYYSYVTASYPTRVTSRCICICTRGTIQSCLHLIFICI